MKKLTVSSEKDKYGIRLKAEPDNQTLGRRLKGAFKQVSQAIKGEFCIAHGKKTGHVCKAAVKGG